jgi:hypothetical protein
MQFRNQQTNRTTKLEKEITLMKTQLLKTIMAPLVVACALVTMVAPTATGQRTVGEARRSMECDSKRLQ